MDGLECAPASTIDGAQLPVADRSFDGDTYPTVSKVCFRDGGLGANEYGEPVDSEHAGIKVDSMSIGDSDGSKGERCKHAGG